MRVEIHHLVYFGLMIACIAVDEDTREFASLWDGHAQADGLTVAVSPLTDLHRTNQDHPPEAINFLSKLEAHPNNHHKKGRKGKKPSFLGPLVPGSQIPTMKWGEDLRLLSNSDEDLAPSGSTCYRDLPQASAPSHDRIGILSSSSTREYKSRDSPMKSRVLELVVRTQLRWTREET
ncbi:hypothetical protein PTTG_25630 [Puccinia triticina 1-1 BBBD Race 1]|uniref:Uncharacterized protein n=1 Tax=Puccinia triticina (isolate 1-1 / race 1 (BBBD)) TaxID=630390 RepID=A0A180H114_PUCT1|nr:hypothetical protein PTTG_25630 [Puccinia triticina 1-1 BBBD Race 1]